MEGIVVEAGNGVTSSGEETGPFDVTPSDCCSGSEWDGMGAITETSSGVERRGRMMSSNGEGGHSGEPNKTSLPANTGTGVGST